MGKWKGGGGDSSRQAAAGVDAGGSAACSSMIPEICPPSPSALHSSFLSSLYTAAGRPGQTGKTRERGTSQQQEKQLSRAATDEKFQVKPQTSPDHYPILTHQHTEDTHRDRVFVFFFKKKTYSAICACSCLLS